MRKSITLLLAALALAPAARAADTKIVVLDPGRVMAETDEGKAIIDGLTKDLDDRRKVLDAKQAEFVALRDEFEKQAPLVNDVTKQAKQAELQKRFDELQQLAQQHQQEFETRKGEALKPVEDRMRALIRQVAEADGFQLILDSHVVIWGPNSLDITDEVIRKFNAKYPYKGGGTKPAAGAKKAAPAAKPK